MNQAHPTRSAYTLIEVVMAMTVAGILVSGMASTLLIARRAADPSSTPAAGTLEGLAALTDITADLQFAEAISEQTARAITVVVADRNDADTNRDTIRFAWSGKSGEPLTRQFNGGNVADLVNRVHDFGVEYYSPAGTVEYVTVRIQTTDDPSTLVETSLPMLNEP
jgi:prepilin-type N-terminal cleavage/methylation domain-containing protein